MNTVFEPNTEGLFIIPDKVYRDAPGVSHSMLRHIEPPALLPAWLRQKHEQTVDMMIGTLTHDATLEPGKLCQRLKIPPAQFPAPASHSLVKKKVVSEGDMIDWSWQSNFCKEWRRKQEAAGNRVVNQSDYDTMLGCVEALLNHSTVKDILADSQMEVSAFAKWEHNGQLIMRKGRIDIVPSNQFKLDGLSFLSDIKTGPEGCANQRVWANNAIDKGYITQACYYLDLWNFLMPDDQRDTFVHIVVEKAEPFLVGIFSIRPGDLDIFRMVNSRRLRSYAECTEANHWPGYGDEVRELKLPAWVFNTPVDELR